MTPEKKFANAMRYAVSVGLLDINITSFRGWNAGCDCIECRSQRIIYDFLFSDDHREDFLDSREDMENE